MVKRLTDEEMFDQDYSVNRPTDKKYSGEYLAARRTLADRVKADAMRAKVEKSKDNPFEGDPGADRFVETGEGLEIEDAEE